MLRAVSVGLHLDARHPGFVLKRRNGLNSCDENSNFGRRMLSKTKPIKQNFADALWSDSLLGILLATFFYALFWIGVINSSWLARYVLGHPVSIATVYLFCIAMVVLCHKGITSFVQKKKIGPANNTLLDLMQSMPAGLVIDSVRWLDYMLPAQSGSFASSYFGTRFMRFLRRVLQRSNIEQFDKDLQELAEEDANNQHDAYSIVRIICWAMPMLGFLGTVVGISQTLGSMDMQLLASGDQAAMDSLTAGLYIAFDTTAIGLVLTIVAMFVQFIVSGWEVQLLRRIDSLVADRAFALIKVEPKSEDESAQLVSQLAKTVVESVSLALEQLISRQAGIWSAAMEKIDDRSVKNFESASNHLTKSLQKSISPALESMAKEVGKCELDAIAALDARYQQWQTTLSDHSRTLAAHHDELAKQTQLLMNLVERCDGFSALDESIQQTLGRMTNVDRFHEAAICMTEAIAVLGIHLERSGVLEKARHKQAGSGRSLNLFNEADTAERDAA